MRERRNEKQARFAVGITLAALTLGALPGVSRAQSSGGDGSENSKIDLTLDTGSPPSAPPASKVIVHRAANPAASVPTPQRSQTPLASRGGTISRGDFRQAPATAPRVLAQLALVSTSSLPIRVERLPEARILSSVNQGTYLAVVADGGDWWGVLMVNNTMGWVPKNALQMINYQTEVAVGAPPAAHPVASPQVATNGAAGSVGSWADGLDGRTASLLREAFSYLGVPYVWAGNTRSGIDCSGFVKAVFGSQGISLPRHSGDQAKVGQPVSGEDLRPGDRLYFDMGRKGEVSHCGIYLGNGYFIHASTNHHRVDVDALAKPNYARALVAIRRS